MEPIGRIMLQRPRCALALAIVAMASGCDDPVEPPGEVDPRHVLTLVYHAMGGPRWDNRDNWTTYAPLDTWYGVTTGSEGVTGLELGRNGLTSSIPPELGNLTSLLTVDFEYNGLIGPIPPELGNLLNLEYLNLGLKGTMPPELGNLQNLRVLSLPDNLLSGPIPPELGNLENLSHMSVDINQLSGPLPGELIGVPLNAFYWNRTRLCAPANEEFQEWLASIVDQVGQRNCRPGEAGRPRPTAPGKFTLQSQLVRRPGTLGSSRTVRSAHPRSPRS